MVNFSSERTQLKKIEIVIIKRKFLSKQKQSGPPSTEGSRLEMISLTRRTSYFYDNWESINAPSQVLNIIQWIQNSFVKKALNSLIIL